MKFRVMLFLAALFLFVAPYLSTANAAYGNKEASVVQVIDGDTLSVDIADWPAVIGSRIGVRLAGVDTPEKAGGCASEIALSSTARTEAALFVSGGNGIVDLRNIRRDKYFRMLADVYVGNNSLAKHLVSKGLAVPYSGGKKKNWCVP